MNKTTRPLVSIAMAAALTLTLAGCENLPGVDSSNLPSISRSAAPSRSPEPVPTRTEIITAEPAPESPEPVPTRTQIITAEPEPTETAAPEESADEEPTVWWPWLLLAVALLAGVVAWWRFASKRSAWDKRLSHAAAEISWFEDSLIPQVLSKPSAAEAASLWQAARPRVLQVDRELHELAEASPSTDRAARANRGLQVLLSLTSAIDAETATTPGADADALRAQRAAVDAARDGARAWIASAKG